MSEIIQLKGHNIKEYDLNCDDVYPITIAKAVFMDDDHLETLHEWAQSITGSSDIPVIKQDIALVKVQLNQLEVSHTSVKDMAATTQDKLKSFLLEKWNEFLEMAKRHDVFPGEDLDQYKEE